MSVLNEVMQSVIKCINYIKADGKRDRLFKSSPSHRLIEKSEMKNLLTIDGKAFLSYLADIFEKINMLNKQLQGMDKTLVDAKSKIFGFVTLLYYIYLKLFDQFYYLKKCEVTDAAVLVIIDHLKLLASDLKHIEFPVWMFVMRQKINTVSTSYAKKFLLPFPSSS